MKGHGLRTRCKVWASIIMHAAQCTKESGKTTCRREKAFMSSQMGLYIKASGDSTKCMALGFTLTRTAESGKESIGTASSRPRDKKNSFKKSKSSTENNSLKGLFWPRLQICWKL